MVIAPAQYDTYNAFLCALCRKDVIAAAIQYYRTPRPGRDALWDPLDHEGLPTWDLPPWVELAPLRAALDANDRGDTIGVHRAYRGASPLTKRTIERVLRDVRR